MTEFFYAQDNAGLEHNLEEKKYNEKTTDIDISPQNNRWELRQYVTIALVIFVTFCCCTLFFFMIYRYNGFADYWKKLFNILQPIIIGLVLAYLLNPVMRFLEERMLILLNKKMKDGEKAKRFARGIAIVGSLIFLIGIVVLLIIAVVPAITKSIQEFVASVPDEANDLIVWVGEFVKGDTEIARFIRNTVADFSKTVQSFFNEDMLTKAQAYIASITSGVIYGVKFIFNILVGLIVSVYVMASKEKFAGQAKKIVYAVLKPEPANIVVATVHKCNEIFGGFISGKVLDSAIIGVLAYIVLSIMQMPDTVLVSVVIGVTNVIPFFGPFIGAIPSFLIIVLQNPIQGFYFLIFIVILQQIDGNIIGPKILGNSTGLSAFWVVFAILVFGGLWGFLGMLLGVPIMAVIYYIVKNLVEHFLKKRGLPVDTESYVTVTRVDKKTKQFTREEKRGRKGKMKGRTKESEKQ